MIAALGIRPVGTEVAVSEELFLIICAAERSDRLRRGYCEGVIQVPGVVPAVANVRPYVDLSEATGDNSDQAIADTRRQHVRVCCEPTKVYVHLAGYGRPLDAQMIDVSRGGMQLQINQQLPVGAHVTIDTGMMTVQGEVRHCQLEDGVYVVGVMRRDPETTAAKLA